LTALTIEPAVPSRQSLRQRLLAERGLFAAGPELAAARQAMAQHLVTLLTALEPQCLGLYWPVRGEFNAIEPLVDTSISNTLRLALPHVRKLPPRMEYRGWDGVAPAQRDEVGIPSPPGPAVTPDVVLVPCLGYTDSLYRLGYGGGYFDRWLALNPHVTAVGVAWSVGRLDASDFEPETHDLAMTLIVTERGVI
jgi:5-formyltetrahydrofolate cyclo-ligase